MTTSKEERLRKVEAQLLGFAVWAASSDDPGQDQFNATAHEYTAAIDLLYAEEIGRLRAALSLARRFVELDAKSEIWSGASDALIKVDEALSQGLGDGGDGASNASPSAALHGANLDAEPSGQ